MARVTYQIQYVGSLGDSKSTLYRELSHGVLEFGNVLCVRYQSSWCRIKPSQQSIRTSCTALDPVKSGLLFSSSPKFVKWHLGNFLLVVSNVLAIDVLDDNFCNLGSIFLHEKAIIDIAINNRNHELVVLFSNGDLAIYSLQISKEKPYVSLAKRAFINLKVNGKKILPQEIGVQESHGFVVARYSDGKIIIFESGTLSTVVETSTIPSLHCSEPKRLFICKEAPLFAVSCGDECTSLQIFIISSCIHNKRIDHVVWKAVLSSSLIGHRGKGINDVTFDLGGFSILEPFMIQFNCLMAVIDRCGIVTLFSIDFKTEEFANVTTLTSIPFCSSELKSSSSRSVARNIGFITSSDPYIKHLTVLTSNGNYFGALLRLSDQFYSSLNNYSDSNEQGRIMASCLSNKGFHAIRSIDDGHGLSFELCSRCDLNQTYSAVQSSRQCLITIDPTLEPVDKCVCFRDFYKKTEKHFIALYRRSGFIDYYVVHQSHVKYLCRSMSAVITQPVDIIIRRIAIASEGISRVCRIISLCVESSGKISCHAFDDSFGTIMESVLLDGYESLKHIVNSILSCGTGNVLHIRQCGNQPTRVQETLLYCRLGDSMGLKSYELWGNWIDGNLRLSLTLDRSYFLNMESLCSIGGVVSFHIERSWNTDVIMVGTSDGRIAWTLYDSQVKNRSSILTPDCLDVVTHSGKEIQYVSSAAIRNGMITVSIGSDWSINLWIGKKVSIEEGEIQLKFHLVKRMFLGSQPTVCLLNPRSFAVFTILEDIMVISERAVIERKIDRMDPVYNSCHVASHSFPIRMSTAFSEATEICTTITNLPDSALCRNGKFQSFKNIASIEKPASSVVEYSLPEASVIPAEFRMIPSFSEPKLISLDVASNDDDKTHFVKNGIHSVSSIQLQVSSNIASVVPLQVGQPSPPPRSSKVAIESHNNMPEDKFDMSVASSRLFDSLDCLGFEADSESSGSSSESISNKSARLRSKYVKSQMESRKKLEHIQAVYAKRPAHAIFVEYPKSVDVVIEKGTEKGVMSDGVGVSVPESCMNRIRDISMFRLEKSNEKHCMRLEEVKKRREYEKSRSSFHSISRFGPTESSGDNDSSIDNSRLSLSSVAEVTLGNGTLSTNFDIVNAIEEEKKNAVDGGHVPNIMPASNVLQARYENLTLQNDRSRAYSTQVRLRAQYDRLHVVTLTPLSVEVPQMKSSKAVEVISDEIPQLLEPIIETKAEKLATAIKKTLDVDILVILCRGILKKLNEKRKSVIVDAMVTLPEDMSLSLALSIRQALSLQLSNVSEEFLPESAEEAFQMMSKSVFQELLTKYCTNVEERIPYVEEFRDIQDKTNSRFARLKSLMNCDRIRVVVEQNILSKNKLEGLFKECLGPGANGGADLHMYVSFRIELHKLVGELTRPPIPAFEVLSLSDNSISIEVTCDKPSIISCVCIQKKKYTGLIPSIAVMRSGYFSQVELALRKRKKKDMRPEAEEFIDLVSELYKPEDVLTLKCASSYQYCCLTNVNESVMLKCDGLKPRTRYLIFVFAEIAEKKISSIINRNFDVSDCGRLQFIRILEHCSSSSYQYATKSKKQIAYTPICTSTDFVNSNHCLARTTSEARETLLFNWDNCQSNLHLEDNPEFSQLIEQLIPFQFDEKELTGIQNFLKYSRQKKEGFCSVRDTVLGLSEADMELLLFLQYSHVMNNISADEKLFNKTILEWPAVTSSHRSMEESLKFLNLNFHRSRDSHCVICDIEDSDDGGDNVSDNYEGILETRKDDLLYDVIPTYRTLFLLDELLVSLICPVATKIAQQSMILKFISSTCKRDQDDALTVQKIRDGLLAFKHYIEEALNVCSVEPVRVPVTRDCRLYMSWYSGGCVSKYLPTGSSRSTSRMMLLSYILIDYGMKNIVFADSVSRLLKISNCLSVAPSILTKSLHNFGCDQQDIEKVIRCRSTVSGLVHAMLHKIISALSENSNSSASLMEIDEDELQLSDIPAKETIDDILEAIIKPGNLFDAFENGHIISRMSKENIGLIDISFSFEVSKGLAQVLDVNSKLLDSEETPTNIIHATKLILNGASTSKSEILSKMSASAYLSSLLFGCGVSQDWLSQINESQLAAAELNDIGAEFSCDSDRSMDSALTQFIEIRKSMECDDQEYLRLVREISRVKSFLQRKIRILPHIALNIKPNCDGVKQFMSLDNLMLDDFIDMDLRWKVKSEKLIDSSLCKLSEAELEKAVACSIPYVERYCFDKGIVVPPMEDLIKGFVTPESLSNSEVTSHLLAKLTESFTGNETLSWKQFEISRSKYETMVSKQKASDDSSSSVPLKQVVSREYTHLDLLMSSCSILPTALKIKSIRWEYELFQPNILIAREFLRFLDLIHRLRVVGASNRDKDNSVKTLWLKLTARQSIADVIAPLLDEERKLDEIGTWEWIGSTIDINDKKIKKFISLIQGNIVWSHQEKSDMMEWFMAAFSEGGILRELFWFWYNRIPGIRRICLMHIVSRTLKSRELHYSRKLWVEPPPVLHNYCLSLPIPIPPSISSPPPRQLRLWLWPSVSPTTYSVKQILQWYTYSSELLDPDEILLNQAEVDALKAKREAEWKKGESKRRLVNRDEMKKEDYLSSLLRKKGATDFDISRAYVRSSMLQSPDRVLPSILSQNSEWINGSGLENDDDIADLKEIQAQKMMETQKRQDAVLKRIEDEKRRRETEKKRLQDEEDARVRAVELLGKRQKIRQRLIIIREEREISETINLDKELQARELKRMVEQEDEQRVHEKQIEAIRMEIASREHMKMIREDVVAHFIRFQLREWCCMEHEDILSHLVRDSEEKDALHTKMRQIHLLSLTVKPKTSQKLSEVQLLSKWDKICGVEKMSEPKLPMNELYVNVSGQSDDASKFLTRNMTQYDMNEIERPTPLQMAIASSSVMKLRSNIASSRLSSYQVQESLLLDDSLSNPQSLKGRNDLMKEVNMREAVAELLNTLQSNREDRCKDLEPLPPVTKITQSASVGQFPLPFSQRGSFGVKPGSLAVLKNRNISGFEKRQVMENLSQEKRRKHPKLLNISASSGELI